MLELFINYGLAGVVIYIFYRLVSNELSELKHTLMKLQNEISVLINKIDMLIELVEKHRS